MADEVTETTQVEEPVAEDTEQTSEETQAPDVGEALQQMNQRFDSLEQRLPTPEDEGTPDLVSALTAPLQEDEWNGVPEGEQLPQQQQQQEQGAYDGQELRSLLNEAAQEAVMPWIMQQETDKRTDAIQGLATKYENFKGEAVDAVAQQLEATGQMPQNGLPPDPRVVEAFYLAYEAKAAANGASEGNTAEADGQGATLETGAGPGAPEETVDPATDRWAKAMALQANQDAFS